MPGISRAQRFGLRFLALLTAVSAAAWAVQLPNRLAPVQETLAQWASTIAGATGGASRVEQDQIYVEHLTININYECTGIYVILILLTFLAAYPARWIDRLAGAALGVSALTAVNVLRISVLVRVAEWRPELFAYFHEYVWQGVFLVLVIAYAMSWVEWTQPAPS